MKRFLCICLTFVLILSALPGVTSAAIAGGGQLLEPEQRIMGGYRTTQPFSDLPLKEGHYERWIDRLAELPQYARSFYVWLSTNANAQGALANPALAEQDAYGFYHTVTVHTQTIQLSATSSNYATIAKNAATAEAENAFARISDLLSAVYTAFDRDHPEVFWLNGEGVHGYSCRYSTSYSAGVVTVRCEIPIFFYLTYGDHDIRYKEYRTVEAITKGIALRDETIDDILSQCPTTGIADQLLYLNQVLTERNAYNSAVGIGNAGAADDSAWECLNALVGSVGMSGPVCEGYARAFMVLCHHLGIPCVLVDGSAKSTLYDTPEDHMWNYVKVEGRWYAVDVTWNDPYVSRRPLAQLSGYENEKWMLLGSNTAVADQLTFVQSHPEENYSNEGTMFINGPELSKNTYQPGLASGQVRISLSNPGDAGKPIRLSLYIPGSKVPFAVKSFTGTEVSYSFPHLAEDRYLLVISKDGYATMDRIVTTKAENRLPSPALLGDIHFDGQLHIGDVAELYAYTRGTCSITDSYHLRVADVNCDGQVNIGDVAMAYTMVKTQ